MILYSLFFSFSFLFLGLFCSIFFSYLSLYFSALLTTPSHQDRAVQLLSQVRMCVWVFVCYTNGDILASRKRKRTTAVKLWATKNCSTTSTNAGSKYCRLLIISLSISLLFSCLLLIFILILGHFIERDRNKEINQNRTQKKVHVCALFE